MIESISICPPAHLSLLCCILLLRFFFSPILNGGDGAGEHPTQALLDLYCMQRELGTIDGLNITFIGDIKNGRTVHSLALLAALFNVNLNFIAPPSLRLDPGAIDEIRRAGNEYCTYQEYGPEELDRVLPKTDVLYVTRVQKERFTNIEDYNAVKDAFIITPSTLSRMKKASIVMHPLPRVNEITPEVDLDPRAAYFRQAQCGLFVRMAILGAVLGKM